MQSNKEKASYCLGLEAGKSLAGQFAGMDPELLKQGFQDGLSGEQPKLEIQEVQAILNSIRQQVQAQQRQFFTKMAEDNKKAGEAYLAENQKKEGVITLPSGLQYKAITSGNGPSPTTFDTVTMHYRGTLIDGRVFDSSYQRGEPQKFPVNRLIPGWSEALKLMKVGDKWEVTIPSYLAYGEAGLANAIPPNATLIFEMELLGVNG